MTTVGLRSKPISVAMPDHSATAAIRERGCSAVTAFALARFDSLARNSTAAVAASPT
jgi:hypothetical protein